MLHDEAKDTPNRKELRKTAMERYPGYTWDLATVTPPETSKFRSRLA